MPTSLGFLKPVLTAPGPFATVFMDSSLAVENAQNAVEGRWHGLRQRLLNAGAPEAVAAAVDPVMGTKSDLPGKQMQFVVATAEGILLDLRLPTPPVPDQAEWSPLPDLMPLLRLLPSQTNYLTVRIDRVEGEIRSYGPGPEIEERIRGRDFPITRVHAGGWSESRYQRSAQETWEHNAREIAQQLEKLTSRLHPALIVLSGDVHARRLLLDGLSEPGRALVQQIEAEIDAEQLETRAAEKVREHERAADQELLQTFEQERASGRRAVGGLGATVHRFWQGQVQTLIVADYPQARTHLWVGSEPTQLAVREQEIRDLGAEPSSVRADAALLRAAAATDADLTLIDSDTVAAGTVAIDDGVGAVLRYAD